ncbi:ABC-type dipeptide/oligopeptide/nickel transport system ATPase subunit [Haloactinospora alba]|uniref:ABC-type dipeptide/oligopeptide/nickel transport system ATPase subunit n=1 Tax=Haloactinospora alba TaxID=405555 RepID=A0A543N6T5_9ACTN|nr:dipeptide/oligopeptide/nickel ABC transporter ATP-binding protein [Haloactinospora alba]TQN27530.1 ABC-type dipeptide/oligopeptide/nickel transport system ATPase subunit [Haloactinospora alba]
MSAVLACRDVTRVLGRRRRRVTALQGVNLDVAPGESVAVLGLSGSGKSTLVGVLAALDRPQRGEVRVDGTDVWSLSERGRRGVRRRVGWVPQDALGSFDPRYTVREVVAEGLLARRSAAGGPDADELCARVGLADGFAERMPASLSGGERQRVAVARALATDPEVLLADEPTSGLDVLAQEHVLETLTRTGQHRSLVLVTHDPRVARRVADRVVVLEGGRLVADVAASELLSSGLAAVERLVAAMPLERDL